MLCYRGKPFLLSLTSFIKRLDAATFLLQLLCTNRTCCIISNNMAKQNEAFTWICFLLWIFVKTISADFHHSVCGFSHAIPINIKKNHAAKSLHTTLKTLFNVILMNILLWLNYFRVAEQLLSSSVTSDRPQGKFL